MRHLICTSFFLLYFIFVASAQSQCISDTLELYDTLRTRKIPVLISLPADTHHLKGTVVFSHGYGQNRPGSFLGYVYLKNYFNRSGYGFISIQQELESDSLISMTPPFYQTRMPFWERGAANILFVLQHLDKLHPVLAVHRYIIAGHSNGGDIAALFATRYPEYCKALLTLDNRRMPLPHTHQFRVASVRSADLPADEGVLPDIATKKRFNMVIVRSAHVTHNQMGDQATTAEQEEIIGIIQQTLKRIL